MFLFLFPSFIVDTFLFYQMFKGLSTSLCVFVLSCVALFCGEGGREVVFDWYPILNVHFAFQLFLLLAILVDSFYFPSAYFGAVILIYIFSLLILDFILFKFKYLWKITHKFYMKQ